MFLYHRDILMILFYYYIYTLFIYQIYLYVKLYLKVTSVHWHKLHCVCNMEVYIINIMYIIYNWSPTFQTGSTPTVEKLEHSM